MPVLKSTNGGLPSVDKEVLQELMEEHPHPVLDMVLRYRSWRRGSSILAGYVKEADEGDIIHPNIRTNGARTGRESCARPNLQNVEKTGVLLNPYPVPARKAFRPRPGYVNFHVDYAGIELRLLVHYSRDPKLIAEIKKPGGDPHLLAAKIFYPPMRRVELDRFRELPESIQRGIRAWDEKSAEFKTLRGASKNCNFARPYGASWRKMCATLGLPEALGKARCARYEQEFPRLVNLSRDISQEVRATGGVETVFGRWLWVPKDKAYVGTNYLIQGTAAEILKRAQVRVHKMLEELTSGEMRLLLPIHDELIVECPAKRLGDAVEVWRKLREAMIDFPQFSVPLEVEVEIAYVDWSKKNPFDLN
jgi:DNA polymerase-1